MAREVIHTVEPSRETVEADREVVVERSAPSGGVMAARIVWFIVGVIVTLLALRFVLIMLGANSANGFVDFIYNVSAIFAAPFYGVFGYTPTYNIGGYIEWSTLFGMLIYLLLGWGLSRLFTLGSRRTTEV